MPPLAAPDDAHAPAARALYDELAADERPRNAVERALVERLARALLRLRRYDAAEPAAGLPDKLWLRANKDAHAEFYRAFAALDRRRRDRAAAPPAATADPDPAEPPAPATAPEPPAAVVVPAFTGDWRPHVALDPAIDPRWPVLTGTGHRVESIMASDDGSPESAARLLARFPGLTPRGLAICRACDRDGGCGPIEPPPRDYRHVPDLLRCSP